MLPPRSKLAFYLWALFAIGVGLAAPNASHANDANAGFALQRFEAGVGLYDSGDYAAALEEFKASYGLYASPNSRLYMARCLRKLGRIADALREFERTEAEADDRTATDTRYAETRDDARQAIQEIKTEVARLTIVLSEPLTATVLLNGQPIPKAALGLPIPLDPGGVVIRVEAPGYTPASRELTLAAGQNAVEHFALQSETAEQSESGQQPAPATPLEPQGKGSPWITAGWITAGVGGAALIGAVVFGQLANGKFDDLEQACGASPCPPELQDEVDQGERYQTLANVSLGVGIALVALGSVGIVVGTVKNNRTEVQLTGNGLRLRSSF